MIYTIYTDAAWHIQRGAAFAFVVHLHKRKIYRSAGKITITTMSPTEAEMMAIGHAVNFISKRVQLTDQDTIIAYTDCRPAIDYLQADSPHTKNARLRAIAGTIRSISPANLYLQLCPEAVIDIAWCHRAAKSTNSKP